MKTPTDKPSLEPNKQSNSKPVPIKYIYNIYNNKPNINKLRASTRVEAKTTVDKDTSYKDVEFAEDLDYILSRGITIPDDYEAIDIN
jgi:hypothetical protein